MENIAVVHGFPTLLSLYCEYGPAEKNQLIVSDVPINWCKVDEQDYISLSDMANWDNDPNAKA